MLRSLFGMARSLDKTLTKLMAVSSPAADAFRPDPLPCVEMLALMALSDLEQLEGLWLELMQSKDPESVALAFRLALAHLVQTSKQGNPFQSASSGWSTHRSCRQSQQTVTPMRR